MLYKQQSFSNFEPDLRYLDSFPFSREEFLFFDIETTGFSPRNTSLYLIGAVCFLDEHWTFLQWFPAKYIIVFSQIPERLTKNIRRM